MRLWTIHPLHLDTKGLTACWREALLARKVLEGGTKGYTFHPQLIRFREAQSPLEAIDTYLEAIYNEALRRGYNYDRGKFKGGSNVRIEVRRGQLEYEFKHLLHKLELRAPEKYHVLVRTKTILPHPMFDIYEDQRTEGWEVFQ